MEKEEALGRPSAVPSEDYRRYQRPTAAARSRTIPPEKAESISMVNVQSLHIDIIYIYIFIYIYCSPIIQNILCFIRHLVCNRPATGIKARRAAIAPVAQQTLSPQRPTEL
jgi:hypothetical protein